MKIFCKQLKNKEKVQGFTVIEMVVVISIFSIIASIILFNMRGFSKNVSLDSLAQDMALAIRNIQVEAVSGRYVGTEFSEAPSYGLYFKLGASSNTFIHFADFNNNHIYDGTYSSCGMPGNECLEVITLQPGYAIQCIEAIQLDGDAIGCTGGLDKYSITFTRPESYPTNTSGITGTYETYGDTHIVIRNQNNETASIHLWPTGQVEVN